MEKSIHIVEINNISGDTNEIKKQNFLFNHILDNILLIQDLLYSIYFVYNKETNIINIYLQNNLYFNLSISNKLNDLNNEENIIHYSLSKKDFKYFLFNNNYEKFKNTLIEKIYNHFLNYDHNLWNDINDWTNNILKYKYFKYHLLFIKINSITPFSKK